jgi:plastocyanin
MRRTGLRLVAVALASAGVLAAAAPAQAAPQAHWYKLRWGPVTMGAFGVKLPKVPVRAPGVDGWITFMNARLVDGRGRPVTIRDVMLHHIVFINHGRPGEHRAGSCVGREGEPFYGTGEEHEQLRLPAGYGYRIAAGDRWTMQTMLMSHRLAARRVYVQYRMRVVSGARLRPVDPYWIRANGCGSRNPSYPIYGGGAPGSTDQRTFTWTVPESGRLVAAGGHLHGGARDMWLSEPRCGGRRLLDTSPIYGSERNLVYRIRPILHEAGPIGTRYFESRSGIPVRKGEKLRLTGAYDAQWARPRVMSIMHVYLAPDRHVPRRCTALPRDRRELTLGRRGRTAPPHTVVPLNQLGDDGRTRVLAQPAGPERIFGSRAVVDLVDFAFRPALISVARGARVTWRFRDRAAHNVLLANGPHVVGSPTLGRGATHTVRFRVPGTYQLFCYLHPVTMQAQVDVRP